MPWRELSLMDQRKEFVRLFQQPDGEPAGAVPAVWGCPLGQ